MGFVCPDHGHPVRLRDRVCPECGCSLTVEALLARAYRKFRQRIFRPVLIYCPQCGHAAPAALTACPACGAGLTLHAAVQTTVAPAQQRWRQFCANLSPGARRGIQWFYCLVSAALLWATLEYFETHHAQRWVLHAALSVVFLGAFFFVFLAGWIVPRATIQRFVRRAPGPTKLGVSCNYLTLLLLLQMAVGTWWTRATILAGLLAVSWAGSVLFFNVFQVKYQEFVNVLFEPERRTVDASEPHGRTGRYS